MSATTRFWGYEVPREHIIITESKGTYMHRAVRAQR